MLDITEGAFNSMVIQRILTRDSKAGTALYSIANSTRSTHRYLYFFLMEHVQDIPLFLL